jgi:hypothetical protein
MLRIDVSREPPSPSPNNNRATSDGAISSHASSGLAYSRKKSRLFITPTAD